MLESQKKLLKYVSELNKNLADYKNLNNDEILNLSDDIKNQELIIPVIGGFNAGKSTSLNSFIGKDILPVGIVPETYLAAEIRFSKDEKIEAIKKDDTFDTYKIDEFDKIREKTQDYKFLRIFVDSEEVKNIEPLVLVDMPGFESPLDAHNKAILEYIKKGVFFIVLIDVKDGTIKREILQELYNLYELDREFIVVLSQTNMRNPELVEEVKEGVLDILELEFDYDKEVLTIGKNSKDTFGKILSQINPEKLFENLYLNRLKDLYFNVVDNINLIISSLKRSKEDNEKSIKELESSLIELEQEKNRLIEEAKETYSNSEVNNITEKVINDIRLKKSSLSSMFMNSGLELFNRELENTIRYSLTRNLKSSIEKISLDVIADIGSKLESNKNFLDPSIMEKISFQIRNFVEGGARTIQTSIEKLQSSRNIKNSFQKIFSIIAILTNVLAPVVEALILILPGILEGIFKSFLQDRQLKKIEEAIENEIIPRVKISLQEELDTILQEQVVYIIKSISDEFENKIQEKKAILEETSKQNREEIESIQKDIENYESLLKAIRENSKFLFKGEE